MDDSDKKILWLLDGNSRTSATEIAGELGVTKQAVGYRIEKLMTTGVLQGCIGTLDVHRIGFLTYRVYARIKNSDIDRESEILRSLVLHKHTLWVVSTAGSWDFEVVFLARNFIHFNELLKEWRCSYGKLLSSVNISMTPVSYRFRRDYLWGKRRSGFKPFFYGFEPRLLRLDALDIKILGEVANNCRQSNEQIGRVVDTSYHTVGSRLERLKQLGVLQTYSILVDLKSLERRYLKVLLSVDQFDKRTEEQFLRYCASHNEVVYITEVLGDWQWEIETEVPGYDRIHGIVDDLRKEFAKYITDFEILEIAKEHKHNYFPHAQVLAREGFSVDSK